MVIEEWKNEVHKMEEELKALERKYIDRCSDLRVWGHLLVGCYYNYLPKYLLDGCPRQKLYQRYR